MPMRDCDNNRPTIIIACSEEPLRRILAYSLRNLGCGVECVASHKALVARCMHHHYALIMTSFCAPLLAGHCAALRLRGGSERKSSLFVIADKPSSSEVVALLERGVEQVVTLPVSTSRLRNKIQHTLFRKVGL